MSLGHLNTLSPGMAAQVALHAAALTVSLRPPVVTCNSRGMSLYSNFLAGVLLSLLLLPAACAAASALAAEAAAAEAKANKLIVDVWISKKVLLFCFAE